jgi:hypothetical protein
MLAKGADPDSICGSGTYTSLSALSVAVRLKQTRLIEALILKGAALNNRGTTDHHMDCVVPCSALSG